jgi:16S rRNA (uracil1498-N3)-methyltransferase
MNEGPITAAHEVGVAAHLVREADTLSDSITIDGDDGHHLHRVRRLSAGDHVTVGDGAGRWRRYLVEGANRGVLTAHEIEPIRTEPAPHREVAIAPALSKGTKLETLCVHLTELGVSQIRPLLTERSVVRIDDSGAEKLRRRLEAAVRAAAMQSRRSRLPAVSGLATIESLAADPVVLVAAHDGDPDALATIGERTACTIVTGPEGGLSPTECAYLSALGARGWSLGTYVLRAETAPLAAAILALY